MALVQTVRGSARIGEIASVFPGIATFGRTVVGRGGVRIKAISVKDIGAAGLDVAGLDEITVEHLSDAERYLIRPRDVLLSVRGTQAKVAIVPDGIDRAVATATLAVVRVLDDVVLPEVLAAYLGSPLGLAQLNARARSATGQVALTARDIREIQVPLPAMEVQRRIAGLVLELDAYERAAHAAIQERRAALAGVVATLIKEE